MKLDIGIDMQALMMCALLLCSKTLRVDGSLAVTRSVGDAHLKKKGYEYMHVCMYLGVGV